MKKNKLLSRSTFLVGLFIALGGIFCGFTVMHTMDKESKKNNYSGKQIFAALFFGKGLLAEKIDFRKNSLQYKVCDYNASLMLNAIEKYDQSFFNRFENAIKSSDYHNIESALEKGCDILTKVENYENVRNEKKALAQIGEVGIASCVVLPCPQLNIDVQLIKTKGTISSEDNVTGLKKVMNSNNQFDKEMLIYKIAKTFNF